MGWLGVIGRITGHSRLTGPLAERAGASGFLVKHTEPAELVRAVRVVATGEALLSPSVTRRLISESPTGPRPRRRPPRWTC